MNFIKKSAIIILLLILIFVIFVVSLLGVIGIEASFDYDRLLKSQEDRITYLQEEYYNEDYQCINEYDICSFTSYDILNMRLNELQFLGTHNSYKQPINNASNFFFNAFGKSFGVEKNEFTYGKEDLTNQLNSGIRSIELDVVQIKKNDDISFLCCHSPIFDMNSSCLDFELALKEIRLWTRYNPYSMPISIIIHTKSDNLFFPNAQKIDMEGLTKIDEIIDSIFGYKLLCPGDVLYGYENFQEMREDNRWPKGYKFVGKVMFILHRSEQIFDYINQDKSFEKQKMFPSMYYDDLEEYNQYASVLLMNDPFDENLHLAVEKNFIVRTRIDCYGSFGNGSREAGILSGAQILSTDYPPFAGANENDKVTYLQENYTILRRE